MLWNLKERGVYTKWNDLALLDYANSMIIDGCASKSRGSDDSEDSLLVRDAGLGARLSQQAEIGDENVLESAEDEMVVDGEKDCRASQKKRVRDETD